MKSTKASTSQEAVKNPQGATPAPRDNTIPSPTRMQLDRLTIATPEGVDLELTLAGVGSRFTSVLVDYVIQLVILVALGFVLGLGAGVTPDSGGFLTATWLLLAFVIFIGYDIAFEVLASGRTPGKRMNGLRVVRENGGPVTFPASAVRNILRLIDLLPGTYLVGITAILVSARNQRLGDIAAGTLVVRERRPCRPSRCFGRTVLP